MYVLPDNAQTMVSLSIERTSNSRSPGVGVGHRVLQKRNSLSTQVEKDSGHEKLPPTQLGPLGSPALVGDHSRVCCRARGLPVMLAPFWHRAWPSLAEVRVSRSQTKALSTKVHNLEFRNNRHSLPGHQQPRRNRTE